MCIESDYEYTEVEFLACVLECGYGKDPRRDHVVWYWDAVDVWFKRHFPDRYDADQSAPAYKPYVAQMGFKMAFWIWQGGRDD